MTRAESKLASDVVRFHRSGPDLLGADSVVTWNVQSYEVTVGGRDRILRRYGKLLVVRTSQLTICISRLLGVLRMRRRNMDEVSLRNDFVRVVAFPRFYSSDTYAQCHSCGFYRDGIRDSMSIFC